MLRPELEGETLHDSTYGKLVSDKKVNGVDVSCKLHRALTVFLVCYPESDDRLTSVRERLN